MPRTHEVHLENTVTARRRRRGARRSATRLALLRSQGRRRRLQPRVPHRAAPPRRAVPLARPHRAAPHQPGRVRTGHRRDDQHRRPGAGRPTPRPGSGAAGVLFPTVSFAVFFLIAFIVSWLLRPDLPRVAVGDDRASASGSTRYADPRFVWLLAFSIVWSWALGAATFRSLAAEGGRTPLSKNLVRAAVVVDLVLLGWFKYYGFFVDSVRDALDSIGLGVQPAVARDRPAGRHLVLHVPRHQLRDRHRPRAAAAACGSTSWRSTCRSSRTSSRDRSCGPASSPRSCTCGPIPRRIPSGEAFRLIAFGLFKKVVVSSYLATEIVDPVFGAPVRARLAGPPRRRLRVRHPDLRRLLRLHGHRHRLRAAARHPLPAELRRAVPRAVAPGLLAPLAHDAVAVAARLPLHPARRQPRTACARRTAT